jgi:hypothetical protein
MREKGKGRAARSVAVVATAGLIAVGTVALPAAGAPPIESAGSSVYVAAECGYDHLRKRPTKIDPGCTGGSPKLSGLRWRAWGRSTAKAKGTNNERICQPDCVNGFYRKRRVKVKLYRITTCGGHRIYSRLKISGISGAFTMGCDGHFRR